MALPKMDPMSESSHNEMNEKTAATELPKKKRGKSGPSIPMDRPTQLAALSLAVALGLGIGGLVYQSSALKSNSKLMEARIREEVRRELEAGNKKDKFQDQVKEALVATDKNLKDSIQALRKELTDETSRSLVALNERMDRLEQASRGGGNSGRKAAPKKKRK